MARTAKTEITSDNYFEFSAKELFEEIEKLRGKMDPEIKKENKALKKKLTHISKIANYKEE